VILGFVRLDQRVQPVDVVVLRGAGLGRPQPLDLNERRAMIGLVSDRADIHGVCSSDCSDIDPVIFGMRTYDLQALSPVVNRGDQPVFAAPTNYRQEKGTEATDSHA
jgi:hypothetical protein